MLGLTTGQVKELGTSCSLKLHNMSNNFPSFPTFPTNPATPSTPTIVSTSSWMTDLKKSSSVFGSKKFNQIIVPGAHHAGLTSLVTPSDPQALLAYTSAILGQFTA